MQCKAFKPMFPVHECGLDAHNLNIDEEAPVVNN